MDLLRRGRGVEHEYILATDPPLGIDENVKRRELIAHAIEGLKKKGFLLSHVTWALKGENGNFEYENSIYKLWPFETQPPSVAENGMRIYEDSLHLEISTPIYTTPQDAVIYGKVSEYLAFLAAQEAEAIIDRSKVYCYTSNLSLWKGKGGKYIAAACGTHSNTTVSRQAFNLSKIKEAQRALIPYLVTRIILTGSGGYVPCTLDKRGRTITKFGSGSEESESSSELVGELTCFVISPRSHFVNCIASSDTTLKRGLFNLRDEPHANKDLYWRFHDINWEGIRSHLQIYLRDLLHTFVIAAFEHGYLHDAPILSDPLGEMKRISMDTNLGWQVGIGDGRTADAVQDILVGYYLRKIEVMLNDKSGSTENWRDFELLSKFLNTVAGRDLESLMYCLDWVTKLFLVDVCDNSLDRLAACHQFCLVDQSVIGAKEAGESLFDPNESVSALTKWVPELTPEALSRSVKKGLSEPPTGTREEKRMELLKKKAGAPVQANWDLIIDEGGARVWLPEPLDPQSMSD